VATGNKPGDETKGPQAFLLKHCNPVPGFSFVVSHWERAKLLNTVDNVY